MRRWLALLVLPLASGVPLGDKPAGSLQALADLTVPVPSKPPVPAEKEPDPPGPDPEPEPEPDPPVVDLDAIGADGRTPLIRAVLANDLERVQELLDAGARPEVFGLPDSVQALHWAIEKASDEVVAALLAAGADPGERTAAQRWTALHYCAHFGRGEAARAVVESLPTESRSLLLNARNKRSNTALHVAALAGKDRVWNYLLEAGASPALKGNLDNTPLHALAINQTGGPLVEMAEAILPRLDEQQIIDRNGDLKTAGELAVAYGNTPVADAIEGYWNATFGDG